MYNEEYQLLWQFLLKNKQTIFQELKTVKNQINRAVGYSACQSFFTRKGGAIGRKAYRDYRQILGGPNKAGWGWRRG